MASIDALVDQRSRKAIQVLSRHVKIAAAYLFGSQVEGKADSWSDIDLAIFLDILDQWTFDDRVQWIDSVQKEAGNDIELHFFSSESLTHPERATFASYILAHGVPIYP